MTAPRPRAQPGLPAILHQFFNMVVDHTGINMALPDFAERLAIRRVLVYKEGDEAK